MPGCSAPGCGNNSSFRRIEGQEKPTFHHFPADERRKVWANQIRDHGKKQRKSLDLNAVWEPNYANAVICSDHFESKYIKKKYSGRSGKVMTILTEDAIPTIFVRKPKDRRMMRIGSNGTIISSSSSQDATNMEEVSSGGDPLRSYPEIRPRPTPVLLPISSATNTLSTTSKTPMIKVIRMTDLMDKVDTTLGPQFSSSSTTPTWSLLQGGTRVQLQKIETNTTPNNNINNNNSAPVRVATVQIPTNFPQPTSSSKEATPEQNLRKLLQLLEESTDVTVQKGKEKLDSTSNSVTLHACNDHESRVVQSDELSHLQPIETVDLNGVRMLSKDKDPRWLNFGLQIKQEVPEAEEPMEAEEAVPPQVEKTQNIPDLVLRERNQVRDTNAAVKRVKIPSIVDDPPRKRVIFDEKYRKTEMSQSISKGQKVCVVTQASTDSNIKTLFTENNGDTHTIEVCVTGKDGNCVSFSVEIKPDDTRPPASFPHTIDLSDPNIILQKRMEKSDVTREMGIIESLVKKYEDNTLGQQDLEKLKKYKTFFENCKKLQVYQDFFDKLI